MPCFYFLSLAIQREQYLRERAEERDMYKKALDAQVSQSFRIEISIAIDDRP